MIHTIPKIIHQIWWEIDEPLPEHLRELGETWKECHPGWKYELWNKERIISFINKFYPHYLSIYNVFPYNIQRWDIIRYLILDRIGGMYVDFDYEAIKAIDEIIKDKKCCFALEPEYQYKYFNKNIMFNNALMASVPDHFFIKKIIHTVLNKDILNYPSIPKKECVLNTTGPFMLIRLYEELSEREKKEIYLIPAKFVTPFDGHQANSFRAGIMNDQLESCLQEAYAVHYFFGGWLSDGR